MFSDFVYNPRGANPSSFTKLQNSSDIYRDEFEREIWTALCELWGEGGWLGVSVKEVIYFMSLGLHKKALVSCGDHGLLS